MKLGSAIRRGAVLLVAPVVAVAVLAAPASAASKSSQLNISDGQYVRGNTSIVMNDNGTFQFKGHLHNNGVLDYNMKVACVVKTTNGALQFTHSGKIKGDLSTIFSGNKSLDWDKSGFNQAISSQFGAITGPTTCRTSSSLTLTQLLNDLKTVAGVVGTVIAIL
jgi:hypothetical protein